MTWSVFDKSECSCMSGKKFKNCCKQIADVIEILPGKKIDEQYILQDLLKESKIFKHFYMQERKKIKQDLHWCVDSAHIASKMRSLAILDEEKDTSCAYIILTQKAPISINDVFDAAHEIEHLVCYNQGYCAIEALVPDAIDISCKFANILNDPIVNTKLAKYGFDLWAYYDECCSAQKISFGSCRESDPKDRIELICLYLQKALDWEVACGISPRADNHFLEWMAREFPDATLTAKSILGLIRMSGYETPEKSEKVFNIIIQRLGLGKVLSVKR